MAEKTRAEILGENLLRIRKEKRYSRKELAEIARVTENNFGLYERGKILMPLDKIFALASFLKVSVTSLIGENGYADNFSNVDKGNLNTKISQMLYQRALKLANDAKVQVEEYDNGLIVSVPEKFTIRKIIMKIR